MPLPVSLTPVTIIRDYVRPDGVVPTGYVTFELTSLGEVAPTYLVVTAEMSFTLVSGRLTAVVASTEDPDLTPSGHVYRITEVINGETNTWFASVPVTPSTQNLNDLVALDPPDEFIIRVKSVNHVLPGPDGNIDLGAISSPVTSVAGKTGAVTLIKADVGLGSVDNTSDATKPVSGPQGTALAGKSNLGHTHPQSDVTSLVTDLAGKAAKATFQSLVYTSGNIQLNVGTNTWGPLAGSPSVQLAAVAGDLIAVDVTAIRQANANIYMDVGVKVGSTVTRYMATDSGTPAGEGNPGFYITALPALGGSWRWRASAGDIDTGLITIVFAIRNTSGASSLLLGDTGLPIRMSITNFGQ